MQIDAVKLNTVIANGGTKSTAIVMPQEFFLSGIILPAITTSTAITFEVSTDGVTYYPLHDGAGAAYSVTIDNTVAHALSVDPTKFYGWEYVKIVVADAQTGDKNINVIVRKY